MATSFGLMSLDWTTITTNYFHLVNTIIPGPQSWTYFIPQILLPASLVVPPRVLSHNALATLVFPIILASTIHAVIAMRGPDVISIDTLWWSLYFLVLKDPRNDFQRVVEVSQSGSSKSRDDSKLVEWPYPSSLFARLRWVLTLRSERPLTSWKTGRPSHDSAALAPYITQKRTAFGKKILVVLLPALFLFMPLSLQLHAFEAQTIRYRYASNSSDGIADKLQTVLPLHFSVLQTIHGLIPAAILRPLTLGMFLYSFLIMLFLWGYLIPPLISYILNPASGATHTWSPHLWPRPHFGPFSAVLDSGLRGLWGSWWHQQMRHAVSEPGRWLSGKLGLESGILRYGIICASAFLLSGITHMGLVPPELKDAWSLRLLIGGFFFVQPVGILVEVLLVERVLRRVETILGGPRLQSGIIRMLRLCWVVLFMSLALRFLIVPFEDLGYWRIWPPSFLDETAKSTLRGDWIP